jgi:tight adherence protein B
LEEAGVALRPGEYVVLSVSGIALAAALGTLLSGVVLGLILGGVAGAGSRFTLRFMRTRRRAKFSDQLSDTLQQLAGSLRAGYGLLQAVDGVGRESPEPTSSEFRRLVVEARLGRDVASSLHAMAQRIGSDDFEWVVQAIDIHREVGGDLAEVLDTVAGTIRERNQVLRQVKSLTAEGRLSAYILLALPVVLAGALRLINPTYFVLLTSGPGLVLSGASVVMLALGALWFHKLCKLEY